MLTVIVYKDFFLKSVENVHIIHTLNHFIEHIQIFLLFYSKSKTCFFLNFRQYTVCFVQKLRCICKILHE